MNLQEILEKWMMTDRDSTPLWRLPINEIEYDESDDPSDGVEIAALAENIRQCGLIHPILVIKQRKRKKYQLISGQRRLEATKLLGRTHICAILIKSDDLTPLKISLSENIMRKRPDFLELAADFQSLLKILPKEEVTRLFSMKADALESILSLNILSPYEKRLIRLVKLGEEEALELCKIENATLRKLILEKILESGSSCDRVALIRQAVHSPDYRLTQSEKIFVRDIRVFLNTVERAAEVMQSAGFSTHIERLDLENSYEFTIKVAKNQYIPLRSNVHACIAAPKANVSRETSDKPIQTVKGMSVNVPRETSEKTLLPIDETIKA